MAPENVMPEVGNIYKHGETGVECRVNRLADEGKTIHWATQNSGDTINGKTTGSLPLADFRQQFTLLRKAA